MDESQRQLAPSHQTEAIKYRNYASGKQEYNSNSRYDIDGSDHQIIKSIIKESNPTKIKLTSNETQRQIVFEMSHNQSNDSQIVRSHNTIKTEEQGQIEMEQSPDDD